MITFTWLGAIAYFVGSIIAAAIWRAQGRVGRLAVNRRERLTVVAALRHWQGTADQADDEDWPEWAVATHAGRLDALDESEIGDLADRLDWER